jgi:hypothetical protein
MSISISGSSSSYGYDNPIQKTNGGSGQDPMSQAISKLQSTDPQLASKLTDLQKQVQTMKSDGASDKDIQSTIKSTMDGLSDTEKSDLQAAMPKGARPSGPPPSGPPPSGDPSSFSGDSPWWKSSGSGSSSSSSSASPDSSSLLDSANAVQNASIAGFMSARASDSQR